MDMTKIQKKWQKRWEESGIHTFRPNDSGKKYYVLEMFSYPSGAKLHAGHWYNYGPTDSFARFKRMQGFNVFQPMGFDAFGLPAENYAIKTGVHPHDSTEKNIATMQEQLRAMGAMFDWSREVVTSRPDYYKWTQWMFLQLYKQGLAYRKEAPVNWCPSCNTVLANEQAEGGECERCQSAVQKRNLTQWFFKITQYADELLQCLDGLDWPEKTKAMQKNWIGRSEGGEIVFKTEDGKNSVRVFTTRADTLMGVSYVVLAPEHELVSALTAPAQAAAVEDYIQQSARISEIDRLSAAREKTGVPLGSFVLHPLTGAKVPVWTGDYVLGSYGTGAVMGVPAHDERDFVFAQKYNLHIVRVISGADGAPDELPFTGDGIMCGSGAYDGLTSARGRETVLDDLQGKDLGGKKINFRLRDWLVSRQRYWGAPIPMIYCKSCGTVPVPEKDLPVLLPYDVEFAPDGKSPLAKSDAFRLTKCPVCGGDAERECDTLDTFVCSSWYFLRYPDAHNQDRPFDTDIANAMLPVDKYVGGAEHACMHLLYARFLTKALRDMGHVGFDEPFSSLVHQGIILGPDSRKMSKSFGNVISPDPYIEQYGSDVFRLYLMFGFNYVEGGPWSDEGIKAVARFLERAERVILSSFAAQGKKASGAEEKELLFAAHNAIAQVTRDMDAFSFNTAVARLMELVNALTKYDALKDKDAAVQRECARILLLLLAPLAPHFAEELNEQTGGKYPVIDQAYPEADPKALVRDEVEIAVQINSKLKARIMIATNLNQEQARDAVLADPAVTAVLGGQPPKKVIIIPGRLANIIV